MYHGNPKHPPPCSWCGTNPRTAGVSCSQCKDLFKKAPKG